MTIREAKLIREVKKRCTYRYLAEVYYSKNENGFGNQGYGEDLCKEALEVLYPGKNYWQKPLPKKLKEENMSKCGDFYWWE